MATTNLAVELATDGTWTAIAGPGITNIQAVSKPSAVELRTGTELPAPEDDGTFITAADGSWGSSGLDADDIVYGRPLIDVSGTRPALIVSGFWN